MSYLAYCKFVSDCDVTSRMVKKNSNEIEMSFVIFSESMNMYRFIHVYNIDIYLFENIWMVIFACASTPSQNTTLLRRICNQRVLEYLSTWIVKTLYNKI